MRQDRSDWLDRLRIQHDWIDHLARAGERYWRNDVEYLSLKVVSRGLFLAVTVMLALLYVLSIITNLLPGTNEIAIPLTTLPAEQDLGAIVDQTFSKSSGAVLNVVGLLTLVVSATYTTKALRHGSERVLRPELSKQVRLLKPGNLLAGLGLALSVLLSWLLGMSTAVRTAAINELLGFHVSRLLVNVGKGLIVGLTITLIMLALFIAWRRMTAGASTRTVLAACAVLAGFIVGANFVLLYTFILALVDPNTSGGVVLVLTILAWVNVVARGFFYTACWVAEINNR